MPLEQALSVAHVIIIATPVHSAIQILELIMPQLQPHQVVFDVGSTKHAIVTKANSLPNRNRFVATHPMWGTEFSGPSAATLQSFARKAVVICDAASADNDAVQLVQQWYLQFGMHIVYMNALAHDEHVAYVSHISHITSFALANTVLEKEKEEDAIFELASGGFESTVRLAKSNAATWLPIFQQNREHVLDALNEHIVQLRKFKAALEKENWPYLFELMDAANDIKRVLEAKQNA
jgi:prephenate dehydrogenase